MLARGALARGSMQTRQQLDISTFHALPQFREKQTDDQVQTKAQVEKKDENLTFDLRITNKTREKNKESAIFQNVLFNQSRHQIISNQRCEGFAMRSD
jgi:hypothetical protein